MKLIKEIKSYLIVGASGLLLTRANTASAQIIPCEGIDCTICDFLVLIKNVINLMLEVGVSLAGLFFALGAFFMIISGESEEKRKRGKDMMTSSVYGIVIAFAAWLIIATLLQILTGSESKLPWNEIQCRV